MATIAGPNDTRTSESSVIGLIDFHLHHWSSKITATCRPKSFATISESTWAPWSTCRTQCSSCSRTCPGSIFSRFETCRRPLPPTHWSLHFRLTTRRLFSTLDCKTSFWLVGLNFVTSDKIWCMHPNLTARFRLFRWLHLPTDSL